MKNNSKGNFGQEDLNPHGNNFKFSPLNIGSIDYNTSNNDLDPFADEDIFEDDDQFEIGEDEAFRTHAL